MNPELDRIQEAGKNRHHRRLGVHRTCHTRNNTDDNVLPRVSGPHSGEQRRPK